MKPNGRVVVCSRVQPAARQCVTTVRPHFAERLSVGMWPRLTRLHTWASSPECRQQLSPKSCLGPSALGEEVQLAFHLRGTFVQNEVHMSGPIGKPE
jgi:hypothetical protein